VYTRKGDLLHEFKQLLSGLPKASTYILIASNGRHRPYFSLMEAGYSVLHIILQAKALNITNNMFVLNQDQITKMHACMEQLA